MDTQEHAEYSEDGKHRYIFRKRVGPSDRDLLFVMLNPGTTAESMDDPNRKHPTRTRCIKFARDWGFGNLTEANLFAFRAGSSEALFGANEPDLVGPDNDRWIRSAAELADMVVLAWGNGGSPQKRMRELMMKRATAVVEMVRAIKSPYCLGVTKIGNPKYPLYVKGTTKPILWG